MPDPPPSSLDDALRPQPATGARPSLQPDPRRYEKQLAAMMEVAWAVRSTLHVDTLLPRIMETVTEIMKADRSTFFMVDAARGELWSKVVQGQEATEIRLHIGEGIAGWVAQSGEAVNLADAYDDTRFDRTWDEKSGYRTRSLLCVPILDREQKVIAVIQCLNKTGSRGATRSFDEEDEELLRCIGGQCAIAMESAFLYESLLERNRALSQAEAQVRRVNAELEILYDVEQQISEARDLQALLSDTLERACGLLKVEAGAILLLGEQGAVVYPHRQGCEPLDARPIGARTARRLVSHARVPIRRQRDQGGAIADSLVPDGAGLSVRETLTAQLSDGRSAIGLVQLINCGLAAAEAQKDDAWALRVLSLLASQIGRAIAVRKERAAGDRAARLALLGHSAGALLHDMRTPMTAIGGYTELMSAEQDQGTRKQYAERVGRALDHMETMVQEVLAFAQGKREILARKVYMHRFVESVREMLLPETEQCGVELKIESSYDGVARFDESKLKRVIFNLARNACQAMGQGGTFTWRVLREGERLIFECSDTGPGIPKAMEGRLFESFATHGKSDGTGLGLAMARKIVDAHCGTIECVTGLDQGATFHIELPC